MSTDHRGKQMRQTVSVIVASVLAAGTTQAQMPGGQYLGRGEPGRLPATFLHNAAHPLAASSPSVRDVLPRPEQLISFHNQNVELRWDKGRWQLRAGAALIKDFGTSEQEARRALNLIRELRLNQYGRIGQPVPVLEYWLVDGRAPTPLTPVGRVISFDLNTLRVVPMNQQWYLTDANQMLFNFGGHEADARQALAVLRRYQFNQVAILGRPQPAMTIFLANAGRNWMPAEENPVAQAASKAPAATRLQTQQLALASYSQNVGEAVVECLPFDWRQVRVQQDDDGWKLMLHDYCLARFGGDEQAAQAALRVVQHYRLTEMCRIGTRGETHANSFRYFLIHGRVPRGVMFGLRGRSLFLQALRVVRVGEEWVISDGSQVFFTFGSRADEARQALQVIQHHHFDYVCHLGNPQTGGLTLLLRE
ncbi:MAG: hypothetical protein ACK4RK_08830 [Gemmataceae bacterium]